MRRPALLFACLLACVPLTSAPAAQVGATEDAILAAVRANLARANERQHRYAYKERRTDIHRNPFGRLGTGGFNVYDVEPGEAINVVYKTLIEDDGKPVKGAKPERVERRYRSQPRSTTDDTLDALRFTVAGRERVDGRAMILVDFQPNPDADPKTREGKLAQSFKGRAWVDEEAQELARVDAVAVEPISFGYGLFARLDEGTTASVIRQPAEGGIWLPTTIRFKGTGRAILLRKLTIDYAIDYWDYRVVR